MTVGDTNPIKELVQILADGVRARTAAAQGVIAGPDDDPATVVQGLQDQLTALAAVDEELARSLDSLSRSAAQDDRQADAAVEQTPPPLERGEQYEPVLLADELPTTTGKLKYQVLQLTADGGPAAWQYELLPGDVEP